MKQLNQEEIVNQINILKQKSQLKRQERRYLAKLEVKLHPNTKSSFNFKAVASRLTIFLAVVMIVGGIGWYISTRLNLPPINLEGHTEENPKSHILDSAMPEPIQKHMLEHADGKGKPGVIIQYNCTKPYICEAGLVDKLKTIVKKYQENVYLAPGNYDGKIILTRFNKREILEKFDEEKIINFMK